MLAAASVAFTLLFTAACDDDDPVEPPEATEITITSGNNQTIGVGAAANPLTVTVLDQDDDPMAGVSVTWAVTAGDGTLTSATSTTNASGVATMTFTAGQTAGPATITATVAGLAPVTFGVTIQ
jgi:hypothetical protein